MTLNLPTPADRIRNHAHGQIPRSRAIQIDAIRHGNHQRAVDAETHINRMLDDLLSLRKVEGTGTTCTCDDEQ